MAKKIQQWEQKEYIDKYTGEIKEVVEITREYGRNGFGITYLMVLLESLEILGGKKTQVLKYILNNMDKHNNTLIESTRDIAKNCGVSYQTVIKTLQVLEENDIVSRKPNIVILNPKLYHQGNENKEKAILIKFKELKNKKGDL